MAVLLLGFSRVGLTNYELEKKARDLGMMYHSEIKAQDFYEEATK